MKKKRHLSSLLTTGVLALSLLRAAEGLSLVSGLVPPSGVRSSNTAFTNSQFRYNLNTGAAFNISCSSNHTSDAFTSYVYKDGMVISDGDLENTTLTETVISTNHKFIQLQFRNFQPVHDGVYHCFANTSDTNEEVSSDLYIYGSEFPPPHPVRVTPRYVVLNTSADLVLEGRFRGNFYSHEWIYNEDDPTFLTGAFSLFTPATVTNIGQTYTIPAGSASLRVGYYGPRVLLTPVELPILPTEENTVIVGPFVAPSASINGLTTVQVVAAAGDDVTFTCLVRGFPEPNISITLSGVNASYTIGNQTLMTEATPTSGMEVTRTVTVHNVTVVDCGAVVICVGRNRNSDGSAQTHQTTATLLVGVPPSVGVTPSEPLLSVRDPLTLTCTGDDCVGTTNFAFDWFLDGSPVQASLVTDNGTMSQLSVTSVTIADFGTYVCRVTSVYGAETAVAYVRERGSLVFTTDLSAPPMDSLHTSLDVLDGEIDRYNINPNASFSLNCTAESPEEFTLNVSRMPFSVTSDFTYSVTESNTTMPATFVKTQTLSYFSFTMDLNGIYWCQAVSSTTSNVLESRRILLGTGPAAVTRVSDLYIELIPPNPLELQVTVAGAYEQLTWSRDGVELLVSGSVSFSNFRQALTINSTSSEDAGEYTTAVAASKTVTFQVHEFSAPQYTVSAPTYVIQGNTLTVHCNVTSFPQSSVSLSLDVTPIVTSVSEYYDTRAGLFNYFTTYSTLAVHPSDEGYYACLANITHGHPAVAEVFDYSVFIAIYVRPNVTLSVTGPASVGDVVIFNCTASGGVPSEYSFRWFNGSVEVMSSGSVHIEDDGSTSMLLFLVGPDDFVNYTCTVNNVFTEASDSDVLLESPFPVPFITPEAPDPIVLGTSINLTCASHGMAPFNVTWSVNGIFLARAEDVNTSLSFTVDLHSTDNYTSYTCTSQNIEGVSSTSIILEQAVPPVVIVVGAPSVTVTVSDGFSVQVTIFQYNLQPVAVEWERNGIPISSGAKYQLSVDTSQLGNGSAELTALFTESLMDNGTYTVTAINAAGSSSIDFEVVIMIAPEAAISDSQKPTVTILEGASIAVMCTATGVPAPTISWFLDGVLLINDNATLFITSSTNETLATFRVTSTISPSIVTRDGAFAPITCNASNGVGATSSDSTQLIVLFAPIVTNISEDQTVTSPAPASFSCTVDSYPPSNITWLHNGAEVQAAPPRVTISTVPVDNRSQETTLTLLNTTSQDIGNYTCSAENEEGSTNMTTGLQVLVAPKAAILDSQKPTVTISEGASGVLMCTATGVPAPTISWLLDEVLLSDDSLTFVITSSTFDTMALISVTSTLNATIEMRDSVFAIITCTAFNGVGANSSDSTELIVLFAPSVSNISDNQIVTSPASVSFNCTMDSYPSSNITWFHNGAVIQAAPPRVTISTVQVDNRTQESTLTLLNTTAEDIGTYTCSAVNAEGSTNMTTELQVLVAPEATISDSQKPTVTVSEGASIAVMCTATGVPTPTISWFLDRVLLIDNNVTLVITSSTNDSMAAPSVTSTLNATIEMRDSAFATITCTASNGVSANFSDSTELIVLVTPILTDISEDKTVASPATVSFNCTVDSYPPSNITWFHNGAEVQAAPPRVTISTVHVDNRTQESTLTLLNTTAEDIGTYTCSAENAERSTNMTTELQVLVQAEIDVSTFQDLYIVNEGQNVTFSCSAFGVPAPNISWQRDAVEFSPFSDSRVVLYPEVTTQVDYMGPVYRTTRMLTLNNVMDSDTRNTLGDMYQCVAVNTVGGSRSVEDVENFTLFVQVAPTFVQDVTPTNVTFPADLTLTCTATARPRPNITWYKDGVELMESRSVSITSMDVGERVLEGTLIVFNPFLDGIGSYTCMAENVVDTAISTAAVDIFLQSFIWDPPGNLTVNQSSPATFSCTAQGNPLPTISWTGPSANFTTNDTLGTNFTVLSVLTIDSAAKALHEGYYTCTASNGVGPSPSNSAALTIQVLPTVQAIQGRIVGIQERSVTLTFTISDASPGVQIGNIQWTFTDLEGSIFDITIDSRIAIFSYLTGLFHPDRLSLILSNLNNSFEGMYTMTATNEAGSDSAIIELVIEGPPRITALPVSQQVVNGVDVTFDCYALAEPVHSLTWYIISANGSRTTIGSVNGTEDTVTDNGKYQITNYTSRDDYGRLLVRGVQFEDRGTYMCLAENRHGTETAYATLSVQEPPMFLSTPTQFDIIINSSGTVILRCSLQGYPISTFQWRKDSTPLDPDGSHINITTFRRQDPMGTYPFSSTMDRSFQPIPLEGLEYFEVVSELTLAPPFLRTDTANYTCEVGAFFVQVYNQTSHNIPVFILEVPDAPINVTITSNAQRSQMLSWVASYDGNRPITQNIIYFNSSRQPNLTQIHPPLGGGRTRRQTTGGSTDPVPSVTLTGDPTTVIVSSLIPFVEYSYTVAAVNELGRSDMSQPSPSVQTEAAAPDLPPQNCVAVAMTSTSFGVTWSAPDPPNGDIANYTIVYRPVDAVADYDPSTLEGITTVYTENDTTMLVAVNLQSAVWYSIQLAATNHIGTGPFTQEFGCMVLTHDDVPGVPQNVSVMSPSSTSLLVTWDHPLAPDRNGEITGYTVIRQKDSEVYTTELFSNDTSQLLKGLPPFTRYNITVAGSTSAGRGEFTIPITIQTFSDLPTAPVDLEMVDITANGFSLRWDPPSMPNGNINFYQVWLFTHNDLDVPVLNPINISSSSYNFTGLAPFTAYSVQVCAYTIGCGDIDTLNVTTLGVPPEVSPSDGVTSKPISMGDPITISFSIVNEPVPNVTKEGIQWVFIGSASDVNLSCANTSKYTFFDNCLSLTVSNTEASDTGLYQIAITTDAGIGISAVGVSVSGVEPELVSQLMNTTIPQGDSHTFVCTAVADPHPLFVFRFNGERLTSNSSKYTLVTDRTHGTLTVFNVQGSDGGTYSCSASNRYGSVSTAAVLIVEVPPTLTVYPSIARDVVRGENLDATCRANANPAPVIHWFRGDQQLKGGDHNAGNVSISQSIEDTTTSSQLSVAGFTSQDAGVYSCVAVNDLGNDSRSFQVRTVVRPNITGIVSRVNGSVGSDLFHEGLLLLEEFTPQLKLTCEAYGLPPPDVVWLHNGIVLKNITGRRVITVEDGGSLGELGNLTRSTLILPVVELSDAGEYTCRATSGNVSPIPGTTAWTFMFSVTELNECDPDPCLNGGTCVDGVQNYTCNCASFTEHGVLIYYTGRNCGTVVDNREAPYVTKSPSSRKVKLNDKICLTCSATGNPTPIIRWYKDGKPIYGPQAIGDVFVIPEAMPNERGFYHCEAFSSFGDPSKSAEALILIEGIVQFRIKVMLENGNPSSRKKRQAIANTDFIENLRLQTVNQPLAVEGNYTATVYSVEPAGDNSSDIVITVATDSSEPPATLTDQLIQPLRQMLEEVSDINEQISFMIMATERHDGCPKQPDSACGNVGPVTWPETEIGQVATVSCSCGIDDPLIQLLSGTRRCGGTYDTGAEWEEAQCDSCIFSDTRRELCALAEIDSPAQLANVLVNITDSDEIESEDVSLTVVLLDTVANSTEDLQQEDVQTDVLLIVSNVQQVPADQLAESQRKTMSSNRILEIVEDVLDVVEVTPEEPFEFAAPDFGVRVEDPPEDLGEEETYTPNLGALLTQVMSSTMTSVEMPEVPSAAVTLSSTLLQRDNQGNRPRISTSVFARDSLFQQRDSFVRRNNLANEIVGGIVLDLTLRSNGEVNTVLERPNSNVVRPRFTKSVRARDEGSRTSCRFWNLTADEGFGAWDNSSCRVLNETQVEVTCGCDHLTHFAILLDISPDHPPTSAPAEDALTWVSYIGTVLSIICLAITIITYLGEKNLRKALHIKLLLNLCFALVGLYVTFIISTVSTSVPVLCGVVSALMHYFFLVVFFWMAAEAIHLHRKLVTVFKPDITNYLFIAMAICWVVPAFIVAFSLAPHYHNYIHEQYCRVYGYSFWIGLLIPFGFIYIMNWIIFILIFASLLCRPNVREETRNHTNLRKLKDNFIIAIGLSLLFGAGWALGLLASSDLPHAVRSPAEWIFTLVNAFLGVYLFVLYVVRSPEARVLWKKWLLCQRKRTIDIPSSSIRRTWTSTLRSWAKRSTLRKSGKDTSNVASVNTFTFSNPSAGVPDITSHTAGPSSVMETSTTGIMSPTLPSVEVELLPSVPDRQPNNEEAAQAISAPKLPVKLDVDTECLIETMFFDDDSSLLSFGAPPAQSYSSLSRPDADHHIVETKETERPDYIP